MTEEWIAMYLTKELIQALVLTEVLELLAAAFFSDRNKRDFLLVFLVNIVTNPLVVYLDYWFRFRMPSVVIWIGALEFAVWLSESLIYRKCLTGKQNPFLYSFVLNAVSYFGGMVIGKLL